MLTILSLSQRHSTVAERARFGLSETDRARLYRAIRRSCHGQVAFLATCNRVEVVAWMEALHRPDAIGVARRIGQWLFPDLSSDFMRQAKALFDDDAASHLMRVAGGLESQVQGDVQVLGQVRSAYLEAAQAGSIGSELHRLFQITLHAGKRIHHETGLGSAGASVGRMAAEELLGCLAHHSPQPRIVVIGAGQTGSAAATELTRRGARVVILNRSLEPAESLASRLDAVAAPFEVRHQALALADGAIIATGATEPIIVSHALSRARESQGRVGLPLRILDLSVPVSTEAGVALLSGIHLMTLDDLPGRDSDGQVSAARVIVNREVARFRQWLRGRQDRWARVA